MLEGSQNDDYVADTEGSLWYAGRWSNFICECNDWPSRACQKTRQVTSLLILHPSVSLLLFVSYYLAMAYIPFRQI